MSTPVPKRVHLQAKQCGFGDTLLLTFEYEKDLDDGRRERHVFIDFGSSHWPKKSAPTYAEIAREVAQRTDGQLDVIVVTHRHKDHLAGYGNPEAGEIIAGLKPRLVVRPWTEDPKLPEKAKGPRAIGTASRDFVSGLTAAQKFAGEVHESLRGTRGLRASLAMMAAHQVPNKAAIERLDQLAEDAELGARYLYAGQKSGLEKAIPGVEVSVLGPPTPDQWPRVASQKANDPEYWVGQRRRLRNMLDSAEEPLLGEDPDVPEVGQQIEPGPARWLVEKMKGEQTSSLLRIVRSLDDAMNNTSLILLFRVGSRRLLFPGDAQIENWSYALQDGKAAELGADLAAVDLYKVGHHGSRNATPRSLIEMWRKEGRRVTSVMSTMPGVHGETEATAVPRSTLVEALEALGPLQRTDALSAGSRYLELSGSTARRTAYTVTYGKPESG